jgi:hypothetical protein
MDKIIEFKNRHKEKNLFILASGPSLKELDLSGLSRRITMGLNRSFMVYPEPYYHCVFDHRLFELYPDELKKCRVLFTLEDRPWGLPLNLLGSKGFSWDLEEGIYSGYTISFFALQLAVYMGFERVFFLGLDLDFKEKDTHFFGYDYHSKDHKTTEFPKMLESFQSIAPTLKERGIQVYNCSPVSKLGVFPHMSFEDAMKF